MDRMTFREMIRPLSSYEEELKRTQSSNRLMEQSIQYAYKKDKDGYYFFTNLAMSDQGGHTPDPMHASLSHTILKDKLRLIIHARFSARPFHYDEFISVNYVYSGSLTLRFPDSTVILKKGELFLMNTDVVHAFEIESEEDLILGIQIEREFLSKELRCGLSDNGPLTDFLVNTLAGKESVFSYLIAD